MLNEDNNSQEIEEKDLKHDIERNNIYIDIYHRISRSIVFQLEILQEILL